MVKTKRNVTIAGITRVKKKLVGSIGSSHPTAAIAGDGNSPIGIKIIVKLKSTKYDQI
jgi:hypothetical protein